MDVRVSLSPGRVRRTVMVGACCPAVCAGGLATPQVMMSEFIAAVHAGLFGPVGRERVFEYYAGTRATAREAELFDEWVIAFPPIDKEAFAVLARMFIIVEARYVAIQQWGRRGRPVRALEKLGLHGPSAVPWQVEKHIGECAERAKIRISFRRYVPESIQRKTCEKLRAWAFIVGLGGFTGGRELPTSTGFLGGLGTLQLGSASLVFTELHNFVAGTDAWNTLWEGLLRVHRVAPIRRVEIVGGKHE